MVSLISHFHFCTVSALAMSTSAPSPSPIHTVAESHLILQFDGCLRPARDPGFPTTRHRMAVCAACIGKVHTDDYASTATPLAVGARVLPISTEITSQHAEYEGLLMGLEWLVEHVSRPYGNKNDLFDNDIRAKDSCDNSTLLQPGQTATILVTIEGDCKTVIDQLTGKSNPRKLESLYKRAKKLIDELCSKHIAISSGVDSKVDAKLRAEYRHIPRSQNRISDSICNNLMDIIYAKSWMDIIHKLENAEDQISDHELSFSKSPASSMSLTKIFETASKTTKYSLRPHLYGRMANIALKAQYYDLLVKIGEAMVKEESRILRKQNGADQVHNDPIRKSALTTKVAVRKTALGYQIRGWEGLGNKKKVTFLRRKHRRILGNDVLNDRRVDNRNTNLDGTTIQLSESTQSGQISSQTLKSLGDIAEGEWDVFIPQVWKPILDEWFASVRYERLVEIEDNLSPFWIGNACNS